jgi:cytochrome c oxidase subunit 3
MQFERSTLAETHTALAHHFDDAEQQREASSLGMWVFLVTELLFFGGLFAGYTIYRWKFPLGFMEGSHHLDIRLGGFNTVVLITSSLTMALAVHAAQLGRRKLLVTMLLCTMVLGAGFLGIKIFEYGHKYAEHLVPGINFAVKGPRANEVFVFLSFYFGMTGMHALHMIVGLGIMTVLVIQSVRGRFSSAYYTPVEISGLYWHFVDIIWIFLFPLLYLIGRHL